MKVKKPSIESLTIRVLATGSFAVENYVDMELTLPRATALSLYSEGWVSEPIEIDLQGAELTFVVPSYVTDVKGAGSEWLALHKKMEETYYRLIRAGVSRTEAQVCLDGYISTRVGMMISLQKYRDKENELKKILGEDFCKMISERIEKGNWTISRRPEKAFLI